MSRRGGTPAVAVRAAAACAVLFAVLAAPLPGEVKGCGGDTSGSIDPAQYCLERCMVEAQRLRRCHEIGDSDEAEEQQVQKCADMRSCDNPRLCSGHPDYFISNDEASACIDAILELDCAADPGVDPVPECMQEELCDPR